VCFNFLDNFCLKYLSFYEELREIRSEMYVGLLAKSSPITGLEWPRGFQEVKVPRYRDNGTG